MGGVFGEVGFFQGVGLEIEEFFVDGLFPFDGGSEAVGVVGGHGGGDLVEGLFCDAGPAVAGVLKVADVFEAGAAEGFDAGVTEVVGPEVFGEGEVADLGDLLLEEGLEGFALHGGGDGGSGVVEEGWGDVDGLDEGPFAAWFFDPWIVNDEGNREAGFVVEGFAAEAVVTEEEAVIGGEDDEGVVSDFEFGEFCSDLADEAVDTGDGLVLADHALAVGFAGVDVVVSALAELGVEEIGWEFGGFNLGFGKVGLWERKFVEAVAVSGAVEFVVRGTHFHGAGASAVGEVEGEAEGEGF